MTLGKLFISPVKVQYICRAIILWDPNLVITVLAAWDKFSSLDQQRFRIKSCGRFCMKPFLPLSPSGWWGIVVTVRALWLLGGCQTCGTQIRPFWQDTLDLLSTPTTKSWKMLMNNKFKAQNLNRKSYRKFTLSCFSVTCFKHVGLLWPFSVLHRKQVRG